MRILEDLAWRLDVVAWSPWRKHLHDLLVREKKDGNQYSATVQPESRFPLTIRWRRVSTGLVRDHRISGGRTSIPAHGTGHGPVGIHAGGGITTIVRVEPGEVPSDLSTGTDGR